MLIYLCFKVLFIILSSATILDDIHVLVMNCFMSCLLQDGRSALHVAAEKGHSLVVYHLVAHGASVDTKDEVRNL